jgi:hypothetical protein
MVWHRSRRGTPFDYNATALDGLMRVAVALTPTTLLRRLADAASPGEPPEVSVHLSGGQVLDGLLVRIGSDHGQDVVLLVDPRGGQLRYVLVANVAAVEVRGPERFQDVLTEGRLPQPVTGEPVTKLALRRGFAPSEGFPVEVDWEALPDSSAQLANLDRLLRGLREIARDVCADEIGRQAWGRIRTLRVAHHEGAKATVQRVSGGLLVHADLTAALPRDLTADLGRQINALL